MSCCTIEHTAIVAELVARPGDEVTVDKATTTVAFVGVTHLRGVCTPLVRLADGRRFVGVAAAYVI